MKTFAPEWTRYSDPDTGREVTQLTTKGQNAMGYFTAPHFVDGGRSMVFSSDRTGTWEIYKIDLESGAITQLTTDLHLVGFNSRLSICCNPVKPRAYVMAGQSNQLIEIDTDTGEHRTLVQIPRGFYGDLIVISRDGSRLATCYVEDFQNTPGMLCTSRPGEIYSGQAEMEFRRPSSVVFTVDTETGRAQAIWGENRWLNHVQISQDDPNIVLYVHEGPCVLQRMWTVSAHNIKGKAPRPLFPQNVGKDSLGHEFACRDGWFGFQYSILNPDPTLSPGYGEQFFGFVHPVSGESRLHRLPGGRPFHYQVNAARTLAIADSAYFGHEKVRDVISGPGAFIARYDLRRDPVGVEILCRHDSSLKTHEAHPHPILSANEHDAIWASDRTGKPQLYRCAFLD